MGGGVGRLLTFYIKKNHDKLICFERTLLQKRHRHGALNQLLSPEFIQVT